MAEVLTQAAGTVATVTLNRPDKLNALTEALLGELDAALAAAAADTRIRAVVLAAAGRAFCSGRDIPVVHELQKAKDSARFRALLEAGKRVVMALRALPKPVIAAVNGAATGGGMSLALACDFRVASEEAHLGQTSARLGLAPDWGATYFLPRLVGPAKALELALTGEMIDAREAFRLGLVSRVVPPAQLDTTVRSLAEKLAAGPSLAFAQAKRSIYRDEASRFEAALDHEIEAQMACFLSEDAREGVEAFLKHRPPKFVGK